MTKSVGRLAEVAIRQRRSLQNPPLGDSLLASKKTMTNDIPQMASVVLGRDDQILLGRKKSGLGTGKQVCVGGHIDEGETPLQAAIRETQEEIFIDLDPSHVRLAAIMGQSVNHWVFQILDVFQFRWPRFKT